MTIPQEINSNKIKVSQEYSQLVPKISESYFKMIMESIKVNGLHVPIIVNQNGVLLDGYTRLKACNELGIKPRTMSRKFEDDFAEQEFIFEVNLKRSYRVTNSFSIILESQKFFYGYYEHRSTFF